MHRRWHRQRDPELAMKTLLALLCVVLLASPVLAAEETKPLDEVYALKIKILVLERQVIEAQTGRLQCQAGVQYQEKAKALDAAIEAAGKAAEIDLKDGWQPDVEKRIWKKGK